MTGSCHRFSQEERYITCIHESAHAVITALCGEYVDQLIVAPVGSIIKDWEHTDTRGRVIKGVCGSCGSAGSTVSNSLRYDEDKEVFTDIRDARMLLKSMASENKKAGANDRISIRGEVCSILAGELSEQIQSGDYSESDIGIWWPDDYGPGHEVMRAYVICRYLPYRNEFDYLMKETVRVLQIPAIWESILSLAAELDKEGELGGYTDKDIPFLNYRIKGWPGSPRSKQQTLQRVYKCVPSTI